MLCYSTNIIRARARAKEIHYLYLELEVPQYM